MSRKPNVPAVAPPLGPGAAAEAIRAFIESRADPRDVRHRRATVEGYETDAAPLERDDARLEEHLRRLASGERSRTAAGRPRPLSGKEIAAADKAVRLEWALRSGDEWPRSAEAERIVARASRNRVLRRAPEPPLTVRDLALVGSAPLGDDPRRSLQLRMMRTAGLSQGQLALGPDRWGRVHVERLTVGPGGVVVRLTEHDGTETVLVLRAAADPRLDATAAISDWLNESGIVRGPLFPYVLHPANGPDPLAAVRAGQPGRALTDRAWRTGLAELGDAAGVPGLTAHRLKLFYEETALRQGRTAHQVMAVTGDFSRRVLGTERQVLADAAHSAVLRDHTGRQR